MAVGLAGLGLSWTAQAQSPLVVGTCTTTLAMTEGSAPTGDFRCPVSTTSGSVNFAVENVPSWLDVTPQTGTATTAVQNVVFTINAIGQRTLVPQNLFNQVSFQDTTNNVAVAGRIVIGSVRRVGPPPNDNFANAIDVGNTDPLNAQLTQVMTTHDATTEAGEPVGLGGFKSLWWKATPGDTGTVVIDTGGSFVDNSTGLDTLLEVFSGTALNNLVLVASNDNFITGQPVSQIKLDYTAGTTYYIRVSLKTATPDGMVRLNISEVPASGVFVTPTRPYNVTAVRGTFPTGGGRRYYLTNFSAGSVTITPSTTAPGYTFNPTSVTLAPGASATIRLNENANASPTVGFFFNNINWGAGGIHDLRRIIELRPPTANLSAAILPSARSGQIGQVVSAFATIINAGPSPAEGCYVAGAPGSQMAFRFQKTDANNNPIGLPGEPATIPVGGAQSFVFQVEPLTITSKDYPITLDCQNAVRSATIPGVDTLQLSTSLAPTPDIISIASTPSGNGILTVPLNGAAAFAMAAINIGVAGNVTVEATDTPNGQPDPNLPLNLFICKTGAGGACTVGPAPSINVSFAPSEVHTYSVFANHSGAAIPLDPATKRIFVYVRQGTNPVGASSVAVRTP